jgi:putative copper export protein
VPLIAVMGIGMALMLMPGVAALNRPYGELVMLKLGAFLALMAVAATNKWRWAPRIAERRAGAVTVLSRSLAAEYALLIAVLVVTAILTSQFSPDD